MANRRSYIGTCINSELEHMHKAQFYLRLLNSGINPTELINTAYGEAVARTAEYKESLAPHVRGGLELAEQNMVRLTLFDCSTTYRRPNATSFAGLHSYKGFRDNLFREPLPASEEQGTSPRFYVGLMLKINTRDLRIPIEWQYSTSEWEVWSRIRDGVVLNRKILGNALFEAHQPIVKQLVQQYAALAYAKYFGQSVASMCTTPGITKQLWPESTTFLSADMARTIKESKTSAVPQRAKNALADYHPGREDMPDRAYMNKQLETVTNLCLAAQLMERNTAVETKKDAVQHPCYIEEVQPVWINIAQKVIN